MPETPMQLPPAAQQLLLQMQTFQQQYQAAAMQKEGLMLQKLELDKALEELTKTKDSEEVYKAVGPILVKSTKAELVKELGEKKETAELRLKSIDKQEEKLKEKLKETQDKLQALLSGAGKPKAG
jgi:prefoldin beta subunit